MNYEHHVRDTNSSMWFQRMWKFNMHLENVEFHAVDMYFVGGGGGVHLKQK
jgi:hypothetical protein